MIENRRITRSTTTGKTSPKQSVHEVKIESELRNKVNRLIKAKKYLEAFHVINQVQNSEEFDHWFTCKEFYCCFQLGYDITFQKLQTMVKQACRGCYDCLNLFLKIYPKIGMGDPAHLQQFIQDQLKAQHIPQKIRKSLKKIAQEIAQERFMKPAETFDFIKLTDHYKRKGAQFPEIQIALQANQHRIVKAITDIQPNQIILAVPRKQIITLESAKSCPQVSKICEEQNYLKSPKHCMLAIFLLMEKKRENKSYYHRYIKCLPKRLENFPIYYTKQELDELDTTSFLPMLLRKKKDIKEDYDKIIEILPEQRQVITEQEFYWARMITSSRIFGIVMDDIKTDALVPIADMLNHKMPKMTSWFYSEKDSIFYIQNGPQRIFKGEEVTDSYGLKCNSRFLLNYGFALQDNEYNQVTVVLRKHRHEKLAPTIRLSTLLTSDQFKMLINYYRHYVGLVKIQEEEEEEMEASLNEFISKENQIRAWKAIGQNFQEKLDDYKTTIRYDQKLLLKSDLTQNMRNILLLRHGEKKVLDFYIKMSKALIDYFERGTPIRAYAYAEYLRSIEHEDYIKSD